MRERDDILLLRCNCSSMEFVQVYMPDEKPPLAYNEPFAYLDISARPSTVRQRLRGAWRALFGRSYFESAEVVLDRQAQDELLDFVNERRRDAARLRDE